MEATTPMKAIRLKFLDCCCGSSNEVKLCTVTRCPLYTYRSGHRENGSKRELTDEQRATLAERMRNIRKSAGK